MTRFNVTSHSRSELIDITEQVRGIIFSSGICTGVCHVFTFHTTTGITINENADPDVKSDIIETLNRLVPWKSDYRHTEGNSAAHFKALLTGSSVHIPVDDGRLVLGTWQGIYFCEFDGPRTRTVAVTVMGS